LRLRSRKRKPRAVVDTNVVVAGISGFRDHYVAGRIPSADLLHRWAAEEHFVWLSSEDILAEYREVLKRLQVRPAAIGALINLIREQGESVRIRSSEDIPPDPKDDAFCLCAEEGSADFIFTPDPRDFPQHQLTAKVIQPEPTGSRRGH
jgi:predicted nucleic acid-binding protein